MPFGSQAVRQTGRPISLSPRMERIRSRTQVPFSPLGKHDAQPHTLAPFSPAGEKERG